MSNYVNPLPKRLKEARQKNRLSQQKLGMAIGIDKTIASVRFDQYERGVFHPTYQIMCAVAEYLNYPVSYFYEPDDVLAELLLVAYKFNREEIQACLNKAQILLPNAA